MLDGILSEIGPSKTCNIVSFNYISSPRNNRNDQQTSLRAISTSEIRLM